MLQICLYIEVIFDQTMKQYQNAQTPTFESFQINYQRIAEEIEQHKNVKLFQI